MAYDDLLRLTGPVATAAVPFPNSSEAAAITADGNGTNGWKYYGKNRMGVAEGRLAGAFTAGGAFVFQIYEATSSAGAGATVIASSTSLTATHGENLTAGPVSGKAAGTLSDGPTRLGFATGSGGWIRASFDITGTTSAAGASCDIVPLSNAVLTSGR
jgi:hypothetical protein